MRTPLWLIVAVASGLVVHVVTPIAGQSLTAAVDMKAPAPRLANGKPDFSGIWARPGTQDLTRTFTNANGTSNRGEPNPLPFTTWGQAQWDNYNPVKDGDYAGSCMPFGWIRSFTPHPMQIVQNNEYIAFLFEQSTMFQVVNTEGLPHRKDWPPTWFGDSRGRWDGDALVIEAVNFNGYTKLGTIGHPMSDQAKLTMTFRRPDVGHIQFGWVLDDPKTYTRPISNDRVFVLTPTVEIMEYSCMEGNLTSLLERSITPWTGPRDGDANLVYGTTRDWSNYDQTKPHKLTGVIKQARYNTEPYGVVTLDVDRTPWTVILAPPVRMDFRDLTEQMLKPGVTVSVQGFVSKRTPGELRAEVIAIGQRSFDLR
jgi:hypothetical protein